MDFDLKRVFDMPAYENMIFQYVNFDKCRKQIMAYEKARSTPSMAKKHPKESKAEALDLLRCHSQNLTFEPVCLDPFNDARECLFRMDGQMRVCSPELNLFEECVHDPKRFAKFQELATPIQKEPKGYFSTRLNKDYWI